MAIDLAKMRAKLDSVKNKGGKTGFWKPPEGESTIRIVPTKDGDPFKDYWFHYNLGNNTGFLSPKRISERMILLTISFVDSGVKRQMRASSSLKIFVPVSVSSHLFS